MTNYFTRIINLINSMKGCGEATSEVKIIEVVFRTLALKFHHIGVTIEELKNLENLRWNSSKARWRHVDQALLVYVFKKMCWQRERQQE